jgi:glycosyltransferase involved in cell wall biosynthesis
VLVICPRYSRTLPGCWILRIPNLRRSAILHYLSFGIGLFLALMAARTTIRYVNHLDFVIPKVCAAAKLSGQKYICDRRVNFAAVVERTHPRAARVTQVIENIGCRCADKIIVESTARRHKLARFADKIEVIPNGVDTRTFTPQRIPIVVLRPPSMSLNCGRI